MSKEEEPKSVVEVVHQVRRSPKNERGWELVEIQIRGGTVVKRTVKHGPDLRKIVVAKAIAELMRN